MDKTTLNAVVTLRNEISPWLMTLQVAPDGWNLLDYFVARCGDAGRTRGAGLSSI